MILTIPNAKPPITLQEAEQDLADTLEAVAAQMVGDDEKYKRVTLWRLALKNLQIKQEAKT